MKRPWVGRTERKGKKRFPALPESKLSTGVCSNLLPVLWTTLWSLSSHHPDLPYNPGLCVLPQIGHLTCFLTIVCWHLCLPLWSERPESSSCVAFVPVFLTPGTAPHRCLTLNVKCTELLTAPVSRVLLQRGKECPICQNYFLLHPFSYLFSPKFLFSALS